MTKNVKVTDEFGRLIGTTYEKRAKGLVKNGRAIYVDDCTISMFTNPASSMTTEVTMINYMYFNPREWKFDKSCNSNVGERSFIQSFNGQLTEVFQLGSWNWKGDWSQIISPQWDLPAGTPHTFVFWLNGGENDQSNEICNFEVLLLNEAYEDRYIFKLNRGYIKPVLKYRGWELYAISFVTPEVESVDSVIPVQFRFVAYRAPMTVMHAEALETYLEWKEEADPYESKRPQRHNIVFEDGWPKDKWYSTKSLSEDGQKRIFGNTKTEVNFGEGGPKIQIKGWDDFAQNVKQSAQTFAQSAQEFAKNVQTPEYQEKLRQKTQQGVDRMKEYGSTLGDQINSFVTEMTSAETKDKMQDVMNRVEEAIAKAKMEGDRVSAKVLEKVKTTLHSYQENWEANHDAVSEEYEEELEALEEKLEAAEDAVDELEDQIDDMEDQLDDLEDSIEDCQETMAETEDEKAMEQLRERIQGMLLTKSDMLVQLDDLKARLEELLDAKDRVQAEVYNMQRKVDGE